MKINGLHLVGCPASIPDQEHAALESVGFRAENGLRKPETDQVKEVYDMGT